MDKTMVEMTQSGVVVFTINRRQVRNAIDYDVMVDLKRIIEEVRNNSLCKALVITGDGEEAFCSGGDLSVFQELHTKEDAYLMLSKMGGILYELLTLNCPTFALLNGDAFGGGCELATACDFRIAKSGVKFGFVQGKLGITTGWGGGTMLLEKIAYEKACHLLYSADTHSVEFGKEIGFIHSIIQEQNWREEAQKYIDQILHKTSPSVLRSYKEMFGRKWLTLEIKSRMLAEIKQCSILWETDEHHNAVESFLKRK